MVEGDGDQAQADIPLILGYTSYEASVVFGLGQTPNREWGVNLMRQFKISAGMSFDDLAPLYGTRRDTELAAHLYRDVVFGLPAQILADLHVANKAGPVWFYRFGYASGRSKVLAPDQAGHSANVAYIFGTLPRPADGRPADTVPGLKNDLGRV